MRLIEVELKLEGRTVEMMELLERIEALLMSARLRVQRIFALIEFRPLLVVREDLFGSGDVDKLLLGALLLIALLEIVGMPLLRRFPVRLNDIPLLRGSRYTQDFVIVPRLRHLLTLLRFLQSLFRPLVVRVYLQRLLEISDGCCKEKIFEMCDLIAGRQKI